MEPRTQHRFAACLDPKKMRKFNDQRYSPVSNHREHEDAEPPALLPQSNERQYDSVCEAAIRNSKE